MKYLSTDHYILVHLINCAPIHPILGGGHSPLIYGIYRVFYDCQKRKSLEGCFGDF